MPTRVCIWAELKRTPLLRPDARNAGLSYIIFLDSGISRIRMSYSGSRDASDRVQLSSREILMDDVIKTYGVSDVNRFDDNNNLPTYANDLFAVTGSQRHAILTAFRMQIKWMEILGRNLLAREWALHWSVCCRDIPGNYERGKNWKFLTHCWNFQEAYGIQSSCNCCISQGSCLIVDW